MKLMRARSRRAPAPIVDGEACAGELGGAFEVEDAEGFAELPVGLGREVPGALRALGPRWS
jgi:hypothetical protein